MAADIVGWDLIFSKVWGIDFSKGHQILVPVVSKNIGTK